MKIVIDGIVYYNQKIGGISRLFNEILPRICRYDGGIRFQILMARENIQPLPVHRKIACIPTYKVESYLRPWRFWESRLDFARDFYNSFLIGNTKKLIWHSTYYTLPAKWKGAVVVTVYDLIYELYKGSYFTRDYDHEIRKRIRDSVNCSDQVITISNTTRQDLQNHYGLAAEKIQVIHLACGEVFKQVPYQNHFTKPFILYVGHRYEYKNFMGLLESFSHWPRNRDIDLLVVGPNWSETESRSILEEKMTEKVQLIRYADDIALRDLYNQALAFVFPSLYEGFGIPLLEAMACGCPVIASQIPSTLEVAGDVPIYHEPGNVDDLLTNLEQVYAEGRLSERTARGLERVKQYSWERTARQTAEFYRCIG